jgi:hypothetical protein
MADRRPPRTNDALFAHACAHAPSPIVRMCSRCRQPKQTSGSRTFVIKGVRRYFCASCVEQRAILANCTVSIAMKA